MEMKEDFLSDEEIQSLKKIRDLLKKKNEKK